MKRTQGVANSYFSISFKNSYLCSRNSMMEFVTPQDTVTDLAIALYVLSLKKTFSGKFKGD